MNDTTLTCPKCGAAVPLTEALAAPMVEAVRAEYEAKIRRQDLASLAIQEDVRKRNAELDATIAAQVRAKEEELRVQAAAQAQGAITAAEQRTKDLETKLVEAQTAQAEALRKERALAERERELDLVIERRVTAEAATLRATARAEASEDYKLQLMQSDLKQKELADQIADLKRKSEEASNRVQGEVQELNLEQTLRTAFPFDVITEVAKGVNGADCTQLVRSHTGQDCGTIIYESKRTKNWSPGWLPKLREDMRQSKAHIAVLVTQAMPTEIEGFDTVDNVWVVQPKFVRPLAIALRETLVRAHAASQAAEGMKSKSELVYAYMTGTQFRHRVEAIVESFNTMAEDLAAEKRATLRVWAKREAQIAKTIEATAGMFGDLQGISGKALPAIEGLSLPRGAVHA